MTNTQEQSYRNLKTQYLLLKHLASLSTEDGTVPFSFPLYNFVEKTAKMVKKNAENVANVAIKSAKKIANTGKTSLEIGGILIKLHHCIKDKWNAALFATCMSDPLGCAKFIATTSSSGGNLALGCMQYPNFCNDAMQKIRKELNQNEEAIKLIEQLKEKIKEMLPSDSHNPKSKSDG